MPKLNKTQAKKVDAAESSSFEPLEDGVYHARLRDVSTAVGKKSGDPYWKWEFEVVDEPYANRRLWTNTSLSEAAAFKLKEVFDAFGVGTDTDTEELYGEYVKLVVSTSVIQEGTKKGEISNQIDRVSAPAEDFEAPEGDGSGPVKGADGEDLF